MDHRVTYKVYYEDTDCLGVVYHANYLKYFERGRTEYVAQQGKDIRLWNDEGYFFVVYAMNIKFRKPALLGDSVDVVSSFAMTSSYRGVFKQRIERAGETIVEADVELVCLDRGQRLQEFPADFRAG
jgi:tol-pal system-associated acyl-CoA thioesterase